jgi:NAD(P)H dehydrogenase (quinone)
MTSATIALPTARVAVVVHSLYGHTRALAESVAAGAAAVPGVHVDLVPAAEVTRTGEAHWAALDAADAQIWGSPTYMAGVSAGMQGFFEATSGRWAAQAWKDKLAAGFTNSGSLNGDKLATLQHMALVAMQHGMQWIGLGLLPGGADQPNRLGAFIGVMAQSDHGASPAVAPPAADRETGRLLGERVARAALARRGWPAAHEDEARRAVAATMALYFDGLYHGDVARLARAFHPTARYVNATDGGVPNIGLDEYLAIVAKREPPVARGERRTDRILAIEFAGERAAFVRAACSIGPKSFVDLLTLLRDDDGGWRIVAKLFHYDLVAQPAPAHAQSR